MTTSPHPSRFLAADATGALSSLEAPTIDAAKELAATKGLHLASRDEAAGLKCGDEYVSWTPYAGAQSFADYDRYMVSQQQSSEINEQAYVFQNLVGNVMSDATLGLADKAARVAAVAGELSARVGELETDPEALETAEGQAEHKPSLLARAGTALLTALDPGARAAAAAKEATTPLEAVTADLASPPITHLGADGSVFSAFKGADGSWRWAAVWSNAYPDREGEAFSLDAHKEYLDWVDANKEERLPQLWYFHAPLAFDTKGMPTGMGRADVMDLTDDGFAFAGGHFEPWAVTAGIPQRMKELAEAGELGVSHGYHYPVSALKEGVYNKFRTYEISPLPRWAEANDFTSFLVTEGEKERTMAFSETKRKDIEALFGPERTKAAEEFLDMTGKAAKDRGMSVKEFTEGMGRVLEDAPADGATPPPPNPTPSMSELISSMMPQMIPAMKEAIEAAQAPLVEKVTSLAADLEGVKTAQKALSEALPTRDVPWYVRQASKEGAEADPADVAAATKEAEAPGGEQAVPHGVHDPFYMTPPVARPAAV